MAEIEMMDHGAVPLNRSNEQSTVQSGGGSSNIDMYGGDGISLSRTPVSSVQKSGGGGNVDMVGEQGLLSPGTRQSPHDSKFPSDKGE